MSASWIILLSLLAPVTAGLATLFLPKKAIETRMLVALLGPALAFIGLASVMASGLSDEGTDTIPWIPSLNLNFAFLLDGLGGFFGLLVAGIGTMIVLYARGYFGKHGETSEADLFRFYPTLGFFTTAMIGVVVSDYTLLTLLFWEMTSISSFLLIGWNRDDKHSVKLAMQAFFTTGLGGLMLFGGILVFGNVTGVWRWSDALVAVQDGAINWGDPMLVWALVLMFIGAGTKSAQYPFHYWLPGAMAAPTPVSAFLHSATMVKAGVFLVGRLLPIFAVGSDIWAAMILPFGAVTMLYGGIFALMQHDLKRIFAYTTVSQLGLLMAMYGLGSLHYTHDGHHLAAIDLDISQIANHAFYKAPLFITAGAIGHVLSRKLPELNGAIKKFPAICIVMLLAGYGLAAGPGTISFQAKELFLYAIYHGASEYPLLWLVMAMTVLTAMCNVAIFVRLFTTLLGLPGGLTPDQVAHDDDHHDDHHHEHHIEGGLTAVLLWLPGLIIVAPQYLGGIITPLWNSVFMPFERFQNYFTKGVPDLYYVVTHPGIPLYMSLLAIVGGVILGFAHVLRRREVLDINDKIYPSLYWLAVTGGGRAFRVMQTGRLRHYMVFVFAFLLLAFGWTALPDRQMWSSIDFSTIAEYPLGILLVAIVCGTALAIPLTQVRIFRIVLLGACGFAVVGIYLVYQAPDLALTQLMFEIISVILFVIVLRLLPKARLYKRTPVQLSWRVGIAVLAGLMLGWLTLTTALHEPTDRLGHTLAQHSYGNYTYNEAGEKIEAMDTRLDTKRGGGGDNIVNVILVDFRGFDTFGEIVVLGLAAIGVWSMLPRRKRSAYFAEDHPGDLAEQDAAPFETSESAKDSPEQSPDSGEVAGDKNDGEADPRLEGSLA